MKKSVAYKKKRVSRAFGRVWHVGLLHELKSSRISGSILPFLSTFPYNFLLNGKSSQEYPFNAVVPQGSILGPTLFRLYIRNFLMILSVITIYPDDTTLESKHQQK